ncbi:hypothetical protein FE257_006146 [Aspergillus nanangensis]|uniref:Uncharacterized protein n=1 Tax=Aspergillus nanangensis TaxID=2582783 RepID=A0AAD4GU40_ASPNN|nr:hypothetical protein FE257_006146 [Aspergillus nanangensis]
MRCIILLLFVLPPSTHCLGWIVSQVSPSGDLIERIDGDIPSDCIPNYVAEGQEIHSEGITTRFLVRFYEDDACQTELWTARYDGQLAAPGRTQSVRVVMQGWHSKKVAEAIAEKAAAAMAAMGEEEGVGEGGEEEEDGEEEEQHDREDGEDREQPDFRGEDEYRGEDEGPLNDPGVFSS